jgi:chromosome segregation ATPase
MAKLASKLKSGGHFDKIMVMIDEMVADLRKEEAEDIAHRDRCENQGNANKNMIEDLENEIQKHGDSITRMEDKETELKATIESLEGEQSSTKDDMEELLSMRNDEVAAFKQALKDDADAVHVISQAIVVMAKFYKENKIPLQLVQVNEPEYSVDPDKAPETSFHKSDRSRESGGIIAILEMVKEDTEKEMKESIADDKANQAEYEKNRGALKKTLDAQTASKVELEKELADLEQKMQDTHEAKEGKINDLSEAQALEGTLGKDCAWVKTHFDSRREKRKAEIEGLQEAKNFLAGAGIDAEDDLD